MAKRRCRDHSLVLKAKVAVAAMQDETGVFGKAVKVTPEPVTDVATLHAEIGGLTLENNFVRRARQGGSFAERKKMIDPTVKLRVSGQAIMLGQCLLQAPRGVGCGFDADDSDEQAVYGIPVRVLTQLKHARAIEKKTAMSLTLDDRMKRLEACADCPVRQTQQSPSGVLNSRMPAFALWSIVVSR